MKFTMSWAPHVAAVAQLIGISNLWPQHKARCARVAGRLGSLDRVRRLVARDMRQDAIVAPGHRRQGAPRSGKGHEG